MVNHLKCDQSLQRLKSSIHKPWKNAYVNFPKTLLRPKWHVIDVRWNDGVGISKSELVSNSKNRQKLMLALGIFPCREKNLANRYEPISNHCIQASRSKAMATNNTSSSNPRVEQMLADRWVCSVARLQRWRTVGEGPQYLKIVGKVLYRLKDIEAYEEACLIRKVF
jgi:hypothetical protein